MKLSLRSISAKLLGLALLTIVVLAQAAPLSAKTVYVATNGNNGNPGTIDSPFGTLVHALSVLVPGDTAYIRGGTYHEAYLDQQFITIPSGAPGNPITISGYPGETVRHMANGNFSALALTTAVWMVWQNMIFDTTDGFLWDGPTHACFGIALPSVGVAGVALQHNVFKDLEIVGSGHNRIRGVGIIGGSGNTFINIRIHDFSEHGIYNGGNDNVYDRMDVYDNGIPNGAVNGIAGPGNGIQIYCYGCTPERNTVKNSIFHNNGDTGIVVVGNDNTVYNTLSYANVAAGFQIGVVSGTPSVGAGLYNNVSYGNGHDGFKLTNQSSYTTLTNNLSFGNAYGEITDDGRSNTQTTNMTTDPGFVNAAGGDFRLLPASSALHGGTTLSLFTTDIDGTLRPDAGYDIGAYQAGSSSSAATITFSPSQAAPGQSITVTANGGFTRATDWIAVYLVGAPDSDILIWKYTNNSQTAPSSSVRPATLTFPAPATAGKYEFRFLADGGFTRIATSSVLTVGMPAATMTFAPAQATPAQSITVTVDGGLASAADWVAIYPVGAPDTSFEGWKYLNNTQSAPASSVRPASLTFTAPGTAGKYEFRFFADGGFTRLATSSVLTVSTKQITENGSSSAGQASGTEQLTVLVSKGGVTLKAPITPILVTSRDTLTTKIELYIDGNLQATSAGTSLIYKWDTRLLAGNHSIKAVSYDYSGVLATMNINSSVQ